MAVTKAYQQALAGTSWQNYQLVGVQFPVNPIQNGKPVGTGKGAGQCYVAGATQKANDAAQINDCYLANVTMETYVQSTSCAICHSYAAPQGVARINGRPTFAALKNFQFFSFMYMQAQEP